MKRCETVDNLLYRDAIRRRQLLHLRENSKPEIKTKYTIGKSDEYLARKLIKEFEELTDVFFENGAEHKFNFNQMCEFLKVLCFVGDDEKKTEKHGNSFYYSQEKSLLRDMWIILRGDQYGGVNERNLLVFLLAIMGLNFEIPPYIKPANSNNNKVVLPHNLNKILD